MTDQVTPQMAVAMELMAASGLPFYPTARHEMPCGCVTAVGWWTERQESGCGLDPCCDAHAVLFERVKARWDDPDVLAMVGDLPSQLSMAALMQEEIDGGE